MSWNAVIFCISFNSKAYYISLSSAATRLSSDLWWLTDPSKATAVYRETFSRGPSGEKIVEFFSKWCILCTLYSWPTVGTPIVAGPRVTHTPIPLLSTVLLNLHLLNGGEFSPPDHFYRDISGTAKDEDMSFRDFSWIRPGFKTPYLLEP